MERCGNSEPETQGEEKGGFGWHSGLGTLAEEGKEGEERSEEAEMDLDACNCTTDLHGCSKSGDSFRSTEEPEDQMKLRNLRKIGTPLYLLYSKSNKGTLVSEHLVLFYSSQAPFSNFHPCKFTIDGQTYSCVEQ